MKTKRYGKGGDKNFLMKDIRDNEIGEIYFVEFNNQEITINDVNIKKIVITGCDNMTFSMSKCTISDEISIVNSIFNSITIRNSTITKIEAKRTANNKETILKNFNINKCFIGQELTIDYVTISGQDGSSDRKILFQIQNSILDLIKVNNVKIDDKITENEKSINIINTAFNNLIIGNINIKKLTINKLGLQFTPKDLMKEETKIETRFENNIELYNSTITELSFRQCSINDLSLASKASDKDNKSLQIEQMNFNESKFNSVKLEQQDENANIRILEKFSIANSGIEKFGIDSQERNSISIDNIEITNSTLNQTLIENTGIRHIEFKDLLNKDSNIRFFKVKEVEKLTFDDFTNFGLIKFNLLEPKIGNFLLEIKNSDLGKTSFFGNYLRNDNYKLYFKDSKISEITTVNTEFPRVFSDEIEEKDKKFFFSQLKKVLEANGDNVGSQYYQSEYLSSVLGEKKDSFIKEKIYSLIKSFFEILSLAMNRYSNNHGENLSRAFFSTIFISFLLFQLYASARGYITMFNFSLSFDREIFKKLTAYFLEFLSPIHKTDFLPLPTDTNGKITLASDMARFIDSISKLIISYLLYQFIQAFRKYGK